MATLEQMKAQRRTWRSYSRKYKNGKITPGYREREFCSWDGEGAEVDGEHCYVMLKNDKDNELIMEQGIPTQVALDFLCNGKAFHPDCIHVVFGGSYDVNMILKDLSYKHIKLLQKNHRVFWRNFNIQYIARKYFMVSRYPRRVGDKRGLKPQVTITLWDVVGFFQGTFVKSLKEYFPDEEFQRKVLHIPEIEIGKEKRGTFTREELHDFVAPYTAYEVKALTMLMNKLRENFIEAGIHLHRWDGAGAAAAAVLQASGVKRYYPDVNMLTKQLEVCGQVAYGGGHVEMFKYGHTDKPVYHYDVIGAYPSVMPLLPNLSNGTWYNNKGRDCKFTEFGMYKIYWDYRWRYKDGIRHHVDEDNVIYPFFYRKPWQEPRIFYPRQGYSWVWWPELKAAMDWHHKLGGELRILESWEFLPNDNVKPFEFVRELYLKRLEYKALGMGAALAVKLAVNSFYGKMAQTVGYDESHHDKRPPFYNILWAGYITSYIRAKMFQAAMQAPDKIIAIATDGLWSEVPLDLDIGKDLGQWEFEKLSSFTSIQAGVYFATKETDNEQVYHYRGFNQGSINEQDVISAWANRDYNIKINTRRFTTMGTAVASEERFNSHWRKWENDKRRLELFPGSHQKRFGHMLADGRPDPAAATQLLDTKPNSVMWFEEEVQTFRDLREKFLSRKHPLPWDEKLPLTEEEERIKEDEAYQWEVTESEI